ncbi:hypothetical protein [Terrarubrum flagellatum]|uniref:hypothetical protein n=1 Tax=Terrirubrum flagellatum TaxID=2895980 RepID=UPI0031453990
MIKTDSQHCPDSVGAIAMSETVALGLYSPELFDSETGKLTFEAIRTSYLWPDNGHVDKCGDSTGVSVARLVHGGAKAELAVVLEEIARKPGKGGKTRVVEGYARMSIEELDKIGHQDLFTRDDGKPTFRSHAVIRCMKKLGRSGLRGYRQQLVDGFNLDVHRFENGELAAILEFHKASKLKRLWLQFRAWLRRVFAIK